MRLFPLVLALSLTACGKDETAPVITLTGASTLSLEYGESFTDPGATVTDDEDEDLEVSVTGQVDTSTLGTYVIAYDAVDTSGNEAETVTRTVEVVDTTPPVITLNGDAAVTLDEGATFIDAGATVTDAADPDVELVVTGAVDTDTHGTYVITYSATDASGNAAASVQRTVDVVFQGELAVVSSGSSLVLVGVRPDGTLVERDRATLPGIEAYNPNHTFFGLAQDPVSGRLFATSFNDCGASGDDDGCWGNARIDRFTLDVNTLTHEGVAYLAQAPIRVGSPTYDAGAGLLSLDLINQSATAVVMGEVAATSAPSDGTFSTTCTGLTLDPGATCTLELRGPSAEDAELSYTAVVDGADYTGEIQYSGEDERHVAFNLDENWGERPSNLPVCAGDDFGEELQVGGCALTALAISADGTRVYVNEDNDDIPLSFSLDGSGTLSLLSAGEDRVGLQGIAVHPDGNSIYNGTSAYSVDTAGTMEVTFSGTRGNATEVVAFGGEDLLVSTTNNSTLEVWDLVDPLVPMPVTTLATSFSGARFQHHSADSSLFVVVDFNDLATVSFDGTTLTELATLNDPVDVGECVDCSFDGYARIVQVTPDGSVALTGSFVNVYDQETADKIAFRGQLRSYAIAAGSGTLTRVDDLTFDGATRAVLLVDVPE